MRSLQSSLMDYVKDYIQLSSSADSERYDKLSGFISNVYDVGKQHSLLLNVYRADVDKLEVSPVITELFDLHPPSNYKES